MTDNGSSGGAQLDSEGFISRGYNAGMRGMKGSLYEGGHRVPFFIHWPEGGMDKTRDINDMCLDIDLLPTFADLLNMPMQGPVDGRSFKEHLAQERDDLNDRHHFLLNQQSSDIPTLDNSAVMTRRWRFIRNKELYDIIEDPAQGHDVSLQYPEVVQELSASLVAWYESVAPRLKEKCPLVLGNIAENPARLCSMDVMGDVAWSQGAILSAQKSSGRWWVQVEHAGRYRFECRRWPKELPIPMENTVSDDFAEAAIYPGCKPRAIKPVRAHLHLAGQTLCKEATANRESVTFEMEIQKPMTGELAAEFELEDGEKMGAYYLICERLLA